MGEHTPPHKKADVTGEAQEVSGLKGRKSQDFHARPLLVLGIAGQPVVENEMEEPLHEPRTIKAKGRGASPEVGHAHEALGQPEEVPP